MPPQPQAEVTTTALTVSTVNTPIRLFGSEGKIHLEYPQSVSDVVDVLAIGEPIGLESLRRIADAEAVEEAETRGLINLNKVDGRVEVRVAHPLYGEVRRKRSPSTRIRRLRGLVAAELAASEDRDDVRVVVRRAALSLDSDLEPDAGLLVSAARGAVWLRDLRSPIDWPTPRFALVGDRNRASSAHTSCRR